MSLRLFIIFGIARAINLYLSSNQSSCSQYYLYNNVSCLPYCPAGYSLVSDQCIKSSDPLLFFADFFSFTEFSASSFKNFTGRPEIAFNDTQKKTPVPTYSKGFYFVSTSGLEYNSSSIIAPDFCLSLYYKRHNSGTIFQINKDSMIFLELKYVGDYFNIYINLTSSNSSTVLQQIFGRILFDLFWYNIIISSSQSIDSVNFKIYIRGINNTNPFNTDHAPFTTQVSYPSEYRIPYNEISYVFGSITSNSFVGFIYYFILINENSCPMLFYDSIRDCGLNKYNDGWSCNNCPALTVWPPCYQYSNNYCYSSTCTHCTGYSYKDCKNESQIACVTGLNCMNGCEYNCSSCNPGYTLHFGLCLNGPVLNESILITFNEFKGSYGNFFKSGHNSSTYYFNNPENDDPLPVYQRGLYFNGSTYLESNKTILNISISIVIWVYSNYDLYMFKKERLEIYSNFKTALCLTKQSAKYEHTPVFDFDEWKFMSVVIEYSLSATTLTIYNKNYILWIQTDNGYAFYDTNTTIQIKPYYKAFIYLLNIYPYSISNFPALKEICTSYSTADCLFSSISPNTYFDSYTGTIKSCHQDCTNGCKSYYSCNVCMNLTCEECTSFESECNVSTISNPCMYDSELNTEKNECELIGCETFMSSYNALCLSCKSDFYYLDYKCYKQCPTMFKVTDSNCTENFTLYLMSRIVFDKPFILPNSSEIVYYGSNYSNINYSESSKPLPAKSRGFYFRNNSFIYTNTILLPHQIVFGFWLRQIKSGTIIEKSDRTLSTEGWFNFTEKIIKLQISNYLNTWIQFYFKVNCSLSNSSTFSIYTNNVILSSQAEIYFLDDPSILKIGSLNNGFQGFIYMFYISYYQENFTTYNNLWPCSLGSFLNGPFCHNCQAKCLNGCANYLSCSLCNDSICGTCKDYQNTCLECLPNSQLIEGKCKCSEGYFWNSSHDFCEMCNYNKPQHEICTNCEEGYYKSGLSCLSCHPSCQACTSNTSNSCQKCKENAYLENNTCICNTSFYKSENDCLRCPEPCLNCSSSMYFKCSNCSTSFLQGMCYKQCPLGYKKLLSVCIVDSLQSLKFRFDGVFPALQELNTKKYAEPCSSNSEVVVYHGRGVFFNGLNTCIRFRPAGLDKAIVGPSFFVYLWVKYLNEFEIFELFTSEQFSFNFKLSPVPLFSALLLNNNVSAKIDESLNSAGWNYLVVGLNYTKDSSFLYVVNQNMLKNKSFSEFPYQDSENSVFIMGSTSGFKGFFKGFLFALDIFNTFLDSESLLSKPGTVCELFPKFFNECLDNCELNQFMNQTGDCNFCPDYCKFGCIDSGTCQICVDPNCFQCDTLNMSDCIKCKVGFELINGVCHKCEDTEYYNPINEKCEKCHNFCTSCSSLKICKDCKENFTLNSEQFCECRKGMKLTDLVCEQIIFQAGLLIFANNSFLIKFEYSLADELSSQDLEIKIDEIVSDFIFQKLDSKTYIFDLLVSDSIKMHEKHRVSVKFIKKFFSTEQFLLKDQILQGTLYQEQNSEELMQAQAEVKAIAESGKSATVGSGSAAASSAIIGMNPAGLFNLMNMIEVYIYSLIFDVEFDESYEDFIEGLKSSMKIPNVIQSKLKVKSKIPKKYEKLGIESSYFLVNCSIPLIVFGLILCLHMICHGFIVAGNSRISEIGANWKKRIVFGYYLRFLIQFIFDMSIYSLISIFNNELNGFFPIFDFCVSITILVNSKQTFLAFSLFLIVFKLLKVYKYGGNPEQIDTILDEFKRENLSGVLFYVLFIMRRIFLSISIVLISEPFLQVTVSLVFTIIILLYLIITNPFKSRLSLIFNILNEAHVLAYFIFITFTLGKKTSNSLENTKVFIYIITSTLVISGTFNVLEAIINIRRIVLEKCFKRNRAVLPVSNVTSVPHYTDSYNANLPNIKTLSRY